MKEKIAVRDFQEKDMESFLDCRKETASISFPEEVIDRERSRRAVMLHLKRHPGTIKVAESGGMQIGFIEFRPKSSPMGRFGYINIIFVAKGHRKHGVGEALLKEAEGWFLSKGITLIKATVTDANSRSLDFFKGEGYLPRRTVVEKKLD